VHLKEEDISCPSTPLAGSHAAAMNRTEENKTENESVPNPYIEKSDKS
jgi:hypothetical protein